MREIIGILFAALAGLALAGGCFMLAYLRRYSSQKAIVMARLRIGSIGCVDHNSTTASAESDFRYNNGASTAGTTETDARTTESDARNDKGAATAGATKDDPFTMDFAGIELERELGRGGFATVWLASHQGAQLAVKLMTHDKAGHTMVREAGMLRRLRHPCICAYFGVTEIRRTPSILLEYLGGGTLEEFLRLVPAGPGSLLLHEVAESPRNDASCGGAGGEARQAPPPRVSAHARPSERTCQLLRFGQQVASGLSFLHGHAVVHRDVKCSNVLLSEAQRVAKISDFGISRVLLDEHGAHISFRTGTLSVGTVRYSAPETVDLQKPEDTGAVALTASDVYSFGLLLFELLHELKAFEGDTPFGALVRSTSGQRPPLDLPADLSTCAQLVEACWNHDPQQRPSMASACAVLAKESRARETKPV